MVQNGSCRQRNANPPGRLSISVTRRRWLSPRAFSASRWAVMSTQDAMAPIGVPSAARTRLAETCTTRTDRSSRAALVTPIQRPVSISVCQMRAASPGFPHSASVRWPVRFSGSP